MKPILLTVEAFGPFAERVDIDFSKLSEYGAYVIAGPTGAGKTTILDAIVYALYDTIPGRTGIDELRSHFAERSAICSVAFTFEVHGARYRVTRIPTQERPKKTGEGMTEEKASVTFEFLDADRPNLVKKGEVGNEIAELVGLTANQFKQVILLPQGEFETALRADGDERAAILATLFPIVNSFDAVVERLKFAARDAESAYKTARERTEFQRETVAMQLDSAFEAAEMPWSEEMASALTIDGVHHQLSELGNRRAALNDEARAAESARTNAEAALSTVVANAALHDAAREAIEVIAALDQERSTHDQDRQRLEIAEKIAPYEATYDQFTETYALCASAEALLDGVLETLPGLCAPFGDGLPAAVLEVQSGSGASAARDAVRLAQKDHQGAVDLHRTLEERRTAFAKAERAAGEAEQRRGGAERLQRELDDALAVVQEGAGAAQRELATLGQVDVALVEAKRALEDATTAADLDRDLVTAREHHGVCREATALASAASDAARAAVDASLAATLATALEPGCPCPVCGGLEHPHPATTDGGVDAEAVEEAAAVLERAKDAEHAASIAVAGLEARRTSLVVTGTVDERRSDVERAEASVARAGELHALVAAREGIVEAQLEERERVIADLATASVAIDAFAQLTTTEGAALPRDLDAFETEHGSLDTFMNLHDDYAELIDGLDALRRAYDDVATRHQQYERERDVLLGVARQVGLEDLDALAASFLADEDRQDLRDALVSVEAQRAKATEDLDAARRAGVLEVRPDVEATTVACEAARAVADVAQRRVGELDSLVSTVVHQLEEWVKAVEVAADEHRRSGVVIGLSKLLAGTMSGAGTKVALRDWVLSTYLATIVDQANVRLDEMSSGRYSLALAGDDGSKKRTTLNLVVADAQTGRTRPVDTLSGGETFLAAISLALGLADVVASSSGRGLEALFIDEGFGTLDEERLDTVLGVLDGLQGGGRSVGVISHVEELKRSLPTGITVVPSDHGSTVTPCYPGGVDG